MILIDFSFLFRSGRPENGQLPIFSLAAYRSTTMIGTVYTTSLSVYPKEHQKPYVSKCARPWVDATLTYRSSLWFQNHGTGANRQWVRAPFMHVVSQGSVYTG
jgi:hypothetical protein